MKSSKLSSIILHCTFYYATFYGVIFFGIRGKKATERRWLKYYCLISRLLWSFGFTYFILPIVIKLEDTNTLILQLVRLTGCLLCSLCIILKQHFNGKEIVLVVNRFLKLFQKICDLRKPPKTGFGDSRELVLIFLMLFTTLYEALSICENIFYCNTPRDYLGRISDMFLTLGSNMIMRICFLGYLSVGYLFAELNDYATNELRHYLRGLKGSIRRKQLREGSNRLDQFMAIYEEVQSVGHAFNRVFQLPLFMVLMLNMAIMALVSYILVLELDEFNLNLFGVFVKLLIDVIILALTVHGAVSNCRLIKRLSFENYYLTENKLWNLKLEMFLSRLNFYEFRVRLLGLFELSNEFTVFFLSGLIAYLIFVVQYGMKMNKF